MENEVNNLNIYIEQVTGLIASLTNSLRQLSLGAIDLQALALSKKHQIQRPIDCIDDLGAIIEELIKFLNVLVDSYIMRFNQLDEPPKIFRDSSQSDFLSNPED
jgi:hypothetical protein